MRKVIEVEYQAAPGIMLDGVLNQNGGLRRIFGYAKHGELTGRPIRPTIRQTHPCANLGVLPGKLRPLHRIAHDQSLAVVNGTAVAVPTGTIQRKSDPQSTKLIIVPISTPCFYGRAFAQKLVIFLPGIRVINRWRRTNSNVDRGPKKVTSPFRMRGPSPFLPGTLPDANHAVVSCRSPRYCG